MNNYDFANIKAIFFDWDNTLVDAWPVLLEATNVTREKFGLKTVSLEHLKVLARQSTREGFPQAYGENWKEAQKTFYEQIHLHANLLTIFPQTRELLTHLKLNGINTALISNKLNSLLHKEVEELNLKFDIVLGAGDAKFDKPAPDMGITALQKLNVKASEVIYVGDSVTDWLFAKSLNMMAIAIGNDEYDGPLLARFQNADETFEFLMKNFNSNKSVKSIAI